MPEPSADHMGRWQGDLDASLRMLPQKGPAPRRDRRGIGHAFHDKRLLEFSQRPLLRRGQPAIRQQLRR